MFDFYKPDWLYERLPYLYVAAGVLALATLQHRMGILSGGLLIFAGAYVWFMRRASRRESCSTTRQERKFRSSDRLR